jgi:tRNA pseudouridine55 synthase
MTPGIHLAHKPVGPTSFSLVRHFMKTAPPTPGGRPARICHGGTLDPFASGLLLILVEPATRLFDYLHDIPKTYRATVRWGVETDNGDPHGQVTFTGNSSAFHPNNSTMPWRLSSAGASKSLIPPAPSALKANAPI